MLSQDRSPRATAVMSFVPPEIGVGVVEGTKRGMGTGGQGDRVQPHSPSFTPVPGAGWAKSWWCDGAATLLILGDYGGFWGEAGDLGGHRTCCEYGLISSLTEVSQNRVWSLKTGAIHISNTGAIHISI